MPPSPTLLKTFETPLAYTHVTSQEASAEASIKPVQEAPVVVLKDSVTGHSIRGYPLSKSTLLITDLNTPTGYNKIEDFLNATLDHQNFSLALEQKNKKDFSHVDATPTVKAGKAPLLFIAMQEKTIAPPIAPPRALPRGLSLFDNLSTIDNSPATPPINAISDNAFSWNKTSLPPIAIFSRQASNINIATTSSNKNNQSSDKTSDNNDQTPIKRPCFLPLTSTASTKPSTSIASITSTKPCTPTASFSTITSPTSNTPRTPKRPAPLDLLPIRPPLLFNREIRSLSFDGNNLFGDEDCGRLIYVIDEISKFQTYAPDAHIVFYETDTYAPYSRLCAVAQALKQQHAQEPLPFDTSIESTINTLWSQVSERLDGVSAFTQKAELDVLQEKEFLILRRYVDYLRHTTTPISIKETGYTEDKKQHLFSEINRNASYLKSQEEKEKDALYVAGKLKPDVHDLRGVYCRRDTQIDPNLNGNYIDFNHGTNIAACQYPTEKQLPHFFEFLLNKKDPILVVLQTCDGDNMQAEFSQSIKRLPYFKQEKQYGDMSVKPLSLVEKSLVNLKTEQIVLNLQHGHKTNQVDVIYVKNWPDHQTIDVDSLHALAEHVSKLLLENPKRFLIGHCKAGLHRFGTFLESLDIVNNESNNSVQRNTNIMQTARNALMAPTETQIQTIIELAKKLEKPLLMTDEKSTATVVKTHEISPMTVDEHF